MTSKTLNFSSALIGHANWMCIWIILYIHWLAVASRYANQGFSLLRKVWYQFADPGCVQGLVGVDENPSTKDLQLGHATAGVPSTALPSAVWKDWWDEIVCYDLRDLFFTKVWIERHYTAQWAGVLAVVLQKDQRCDERCELHFHSRRSAKLNMHEAPLPGTFFLWCPFSWKLIFIW